MSLLPTKSKRKSNRGASASRASRRWKDFSNSFEWESLEDRVVPTGTWTALTNTMPGGSTGTMLLLSDGSVMANTGGQSADWYKLTPDSTGNYAHGTWTQLASMHQSRRFYASALLPDGRVFVAGGEYSSAGSDTNTGEIYNPVNNTWTNIANPPVANLGDASSEVLPDGNVLVGYLNGGNTYLYHPSTDTWTTDAALLHGDANSEESWLKLPDGSILTYAIQGSQPQSGQRFVLGANGDHTQDAWYDAGSVPVRLDSNGGNNGIVPENGPGVMLADGRAFYIGASGATALYTPPTTLTGTGSWVAGPTMKNSSSTVIGAFDAPAAVEPNGKVLIAAGPIDGNNFPGPTTLLEFDPNAASGSQLTIVPTSGGPDLSGSPFEDRMLVLPSGQVLFTNSSNQLYTYTPDSAQISSLAPNISDITYNSGTTFTLTGTQLNGFSEGAYYGDDAQMASNYPIVRLYDGSGHQWYARTTNWSNVGVATGSTTETVNFALPAGLSAGTYGIQVIGSGVVSQPAVLVFGTSGNDTVTVDAVGNEVTQFNINGNNSSVYGGQLGIYVAMEGGSNTVNLHSSYADVPIIITGGGADTVAIGVNNSSQSVLGPVTIHNAPNYNSIYVYNGGDNTGRTVTVSSYISGGAYWGYVSGLTPGGISYKYADTHNLYLAGSSAGDTFNIQATDSIAPLVIEGYNGADVVNIGGTNNTLANILGTVSVYNAFGSTILNVNDQADTAARTLTFTGGQITATGLQTIYYGSTMSALNYFAGSGGNTITVSGTYGATNTTISPGGGPVNTVNVTGSSGPLSIANSSQVTNNNDNVTIGSAAPASSGTLSGIVGPVSVSNQSGKTNLAITDGGDTTARNYFVGYSSFGASGLPTINYTGLAALTVVGGSGGNTFNVVGCQPSTTLNTGSGNDTVNVQQTGGSLAIDGNNGTDVVNIGSTAPAVGGTLTGIAAPISVTNSSGTTALFIDDSADSVAKSPVITGSSVTGLAPFPISYGPGTISNSGVTSLTVRTGSVGGNAIAVQSTSVPTSVIGNSPSGGPDDTALVGNAGSLSGIAAALSFSNPPAYTQITIDDSADATARTATINPTSVAGLSPALISWIAPDTHAVTINSGSGGNTFNVVGSAPNLTINTGTGADAVNVTDSNTTLDSLFYPMTVHGGSGTSTLLLDDSGSTTDNAYALSSQTFSKNGGSVVTFTNVTSTTIKGGSGNDTYTMSSVPAAVVNLSDPGGANSLAGPNAATNWNINASNGGTVGGLTFTGIGSLVGGSGADNFIFASTGTLSGSVNGGGGTDTLNYSALSTAVTLNLTTALATSIGGTFANVESVIGGTNTGNTITGPSGGSTFSITAANAGKINNFVFTKFQNLVGGAANDTFKYSVGGSISGTIDGGGGTNTIDQSALTTNVNANMTTSTISGLGGTFANIKVLIGGTGSNAFTGPAANSTILITGSNAGSITGVVTFTNFGSVLGGSGNDIFKFSNGASVSGTIYGSGGTNTIDESLVTTPISVNTVALTINGVGTTFSKINNIIGGTAANTIVGPSFSTTYTITGGNAVTVGALAFTKFGNITAGAGNDNFTFNPGGSLSGSIDGAGGTNRIDESALSANINASLTAHTISAIGGTFANIIIINGGTGANALTGPATDSTFSITSANSGTITGAITFTNFGSLIGGAGNDTFKFSNGATVSGTIYGGTGTNTIDDGAVTTSLAANLATSTLTGIGTTFGKIQNIYGGTGANTLTGPAAASTYNITAANAVNVGGVAFTKFGSLVGGAANDIFKFSAGAVLSGTLDGAGGTNTLDESAYTTNINANLSTNMISGIAGTFAHINTINGGTGANALNGPATDSTFNITGANAGSITGSVNFTNFGALIGGVGNDTFKFSPGGSLSANIYGGNGTNTIDQSAVTTNVAANLATSTLTGVGTTFSKIQTLIGGTGANTLTGPATGSTFNISAANAGSVAGIAFSKFGSLAGGAGNDTFVFGTAGTLSGSLDGGAGVDEIDDSAFTTAVTINLTNGTATGVASTVGNIENARGGSGNDTLIGGSTGGVLIGGPGNDTINGGSGKSILIGGTGIDTVTGGSNDDIVIGGSTNFDGNIAALDTILAEWQSADSYATRINLIKNGGGLNGSNKLVLGSTVTDDLAANVLTGGSGNDWFFKGTNDTITDLQGGEQVN